jgi:uncharacterized protein YndB with AHSA1/START domain
MNRNEPSIEVTRVIEAPREEVFQAWIDPELLEQWQTQRATVDARVGGKFRYETDDVEDMPGLHVVSGEFRELVPGERIVSTWEYRSPEEDEEEIHSQVTTVFKALGPDRTEVTVIEACETHDDEEEREFSIEAWTEAFEELADLLE